MKKTITVMAAMFIAAFFNYSFSRMSVVPDFTEEPGKNTGGTGQITNLVINATVTVVLVNDDQTLPEISGRSRFTDLVTLTRKGDTLVIGSIKKRSLLGAGVIYVPAGSLKNIRINSDAVVRSLHMLQVPRLDVVINGECYVEVSNLGELNMIPTERYSFELSREVRQVPQSFLKSVKY